jgi:uncharacterized protein (DUF2236 family)
MQPILRFPLSIHRKIDAATQSLLYQHGRGRIDFRLPPNEQALLMPDSISWRVFKNPISLIVGGIAAVILELAEPSVRTGVWEHSSFRRDPMGRLQRTGLAAMVTVYGARSIAEPMIAAVVRRHLSVAGNTPSGKPYDASDSRLLTWVHATAAFGFANAYSRYVSPLASDDFDEFYREGMSAAQLYGALQPPASNSEMLALFDAMRGTLEASHIVLEFLHIIRATPALPPPLRWIQPLLMRAAIEILPQWVRDRLGLADRYCLRPYERWLVKSVGGLGDRIVLSESPAVQSCLRLGLPPTHLYA